MNSVLFGRQVLVVEDEMLVLMHTEDMLTDFGCRSVAAPTVEAALALIDGQPFDAAMLDMNLDGDETFAVADALAAHGVPFLFATGYVGVDARSDHRDRPVLKKPYRPRHLADALTDLLDANPTG